MTSSQGMGAKWSLIGGGGEFNLLALIHKQALNTLAELVRPAPVSSANSLGSLCE